MARDTALENLHPIVREKIQNLVSELERESLPFRLFEGFRSPERQFELYAQGRTKPGRKVTNAKPWSSYHQYGIAGDFVLYIDGKWSWDDKGENKQRWQRLHELARQVGLEPLSWETPHLQLQGVRLQELLAGNYPDGGDESWTENMLKAIHRWTRGPTPPSPAIGFGRPEVPDDKSSAEPTIVTPAMTSYPRYKVTARNGLRMRSGPGTAFDIVTTLHAGQVVSVVSQNGDWCQVDLEGDGLSDGYCHGGYLAPM